MLPESPATVANKLIDAIPDASSPGFHLLAVESHFKTWLLVGATVVVSTSTKSLAPEYCVKSFALTLPAPPAVILMFTYGLSSPLTVKKYPLYDAAAVSYTHLTLPTICSV